MRAIPTIFALAHHPGPTVVEIRCTARHIAASREDSTAARADHSLMNIARAVRLIGSNVTENIRRSDLDEVLAPGSDITPPPPDRAPMTAFASRVRHQGFGQTAARGRALDPGGVMAMT